MPNKLWLVQFVGSGYGDTEGVRIVKAENETQANDQVRQERKKRFPSSSISTYANDITQFTGFYENAKMLSNGDRCTLKQIMKALCNE